MRGELQLAPQHLYIRLPGHSTIALAIRITRSIFLHSCRSDRHILWVIESCSFLHPHRTACLKPSALLSCENGKRAKPIEVEVQTKPSVNRWTSFRSDRMPPLCVATLQRASSTTPRSDVPLPADTSGVVPLDGGCGKMLVVISTYVLRRNSSPSLRD